MLIEIPNIIIMSNNILDLMAQKALAEEHVGNPNQAIAAVGGIFAQCKKELPQADFDKIMSVSGPQVSQDAMGAI